MHFKWLLLALPLPVMGCTGTSITIATKKQNKDFPNQLRFSVHHTATITLQKFQNFCFRIKNFDRVG
jgi:hypothetical protein